MTRQVRWGNLDKERVSLIYKNKKHTFILGQKPFTDNYLHKWGSFKRKKRCDYAFDLTEK